MSASQSSGAGRLIASRSDFQGPKIPLLRAPSNTELDWTVLATTIDISRYRFSPSDYKTISQRLNYRRNNLPDELHATACPDLTSRLQFSAPSTSSSFLLHSAFARKVRSYRPSRIPMNCGCLATTTPENSVKDGHKSRSVGVNYKGRSGPVVSAYSTIAAVSACIFALFELDFHVFSLTLRLLLLDPSFSAIRHKQHTPRATNPRYAHVFV